MLTVVGMQTPGMASLLLLPSPNSTLFQQSQQDEVRTWDSTPRQDQLEPESSPVALGELVPAGGRATTT